MAACDYEPFPSTQLLTSNQPQTNLKSVDMNSPTIIDVPPRITRPTISRPGTPVPVERSFGGEDDLRLLARQIVDHDPALALLLARAGVKVRNS